MERKFTDIIVRVDKDVEGLKEAIENAQTQIVLNSEVYESTAGSRNSFVTDAFYSSPTCWHASHVG